MCVCVCVCVCVFMCICVCVCVCVLGRKMFVCVFIVCLCVHECGIRIAVMMILYLEKKHELGKHTNTHTVTGINDILLCVEYNLFNIKFVMYATSHKLPLVL